MTNLFLYILLSSSNTVARVDCVGVTNTHIYSIQYADYLPYYPCTNWEKSWIFTGNNSGTNSFYDYVITNRFYRVEDLGETF